MPIYFLEAGDKVAVKIGRSERNVEGRLKTLRLGNHLPLKLIREFPGDFWQEAWLHAYFSPYSLQGEWFSFVPEMLTIVPPRSPHEKRNKLNQWLKGLSISERIIAIDNLNLKL